MECPICESEKNKVVDSRNGKIRVYRRRKCECGVIFTSYEIIDSSFLDLMDRLEGYKTEISDFIKLLEVRK